MRSSFLWWIAAAGVLATGCSETSADHDESYLGSKTLAQTGKGHVAGQIQKGRKLFNEPLKHTNGRACATCHVEDDHTALLPARVASLPANDPLFNRLDADDPIAPNANLTYKHLKRGLVRITLELPKNTDLIAVPPSHPDPAQSLELAAAFGNGFAQFWWDNMVVKGTHLCPDFRTPGEPTVDVAAGQQYEIVTPCDRKVSVWRGVPSVENTSYTAPYLSDGRDNTLQDQAAGALVAHSELTKKAKKKELDLIALFESTLFSNERAVYVDSLVGPCLHGTLAAQRACLAALPDPERELPPTAGMNPEQVATWERGKVLYDQTCAPCHGSITDDRIINRTLHDGFFPSLGTDGNMVFAEPFPGAPFLAPVQLSRPDDEFINIATPFIRYVAQLLASVTPQGAPPAVRIFAGDVDFPKYRMRFYADDARTSPLADLPPLPVVRNADPQNPVTAILPAADPDPARAAMGALQTGPNFANQLYSPDPGRALITGDYADFEGFDTPQLRGIANTAPYFHDNQSETLADVVTFYSQNVFPFIAANIGLPPQTPPVPGVDTLTEAQKADLVAFLNVF
jgi:cytochrome c peroxidase